MVGAKCSLQETCRFSPGLGLRLVLALVLVFFFFSYFSKITLQSSCDLVLVLDVILGLWSGMAAGLVLV